MPWDLALKAIHILFFAVGLALSEGVGFLVQDAVRASRGDARSLARRAICLDRLGALSWLLCGASGMLLAFRLGIAWNTTWLRLSLGLFVLLALNGIIGHSLWLERVERWNGDETIIRAATLRKMLANVISFFTVPTIVALMVFKPD